MSQGERWRSSANGGCVNGKQPLVGLKEGPLYPNKNGDSPLVMIHLFFVLQDFTNLWPQWGADVISMYTSAQLWGTFLPIGRRRKTNPVQWFCYPMFDAAVGMGHRSSSIHWCFATTWGAKEYRLVGLALTKTLDMVCLGRWMQWKMEGGWRW